LDFGAGQDNFGVKFRFLSFNVKKGEPLNEDQVIEICSHEGRLSREAQTIELCI